MFGSRDELARLIEGLESEMRAAAKELAFERAAQLRDEIRQLKKDMLNFA
jgi:excinuclease ABC subunit B